MTRIPTAIAYALLGVAAATALPAHAQAHAQADNPQQQPGVYPYPGRGALVTQDQAAAIKDGTAPAHVIPQTPGYGYEPRPYRGERAQREQRWRDREMRERLWRENRER